MRPALAVDLEHAGRPVRLCVECGRVFDPSTSYTGVVLRSLARWYCSRPCKWAYHRRHRRAPRHHPLPEQLAIDPAEPLSITTPRV